MPRNDLLALSFDDLVTLSNRGIVKRAQSEFEAGEITYTLSENAVGTVSVLWSDDTHCLLPSGGTLQEGRCSCPATTLCRHMVRSVFAYQREHQASSPVETEESAEANLAPEPAVPQKAWNPGDLSDEALRKVISALTLQRAKRLWEEGQVIEVSRGDAIVAPTQSAKPSALIHTLSCNLRFLVPDDLRYTHCDCAEPSPCVHVPLAVWAFRQLPPGQTQGLIETQTSAPIVPVDLLNEIEKTLLILATNGIAGTTPLELDRWRNLAERCRLQGLIWPAEIVLELTQQAEFYATHNARFEPVHVAQLVGELLIRADAIRSCTSAVPALFVRGAASDRTTEVGAARLIGIGTHVRPHRGAVEVSAFMQDMDSGMVVVLRRDFPDPVPETGNQLRSGLNNAPPAPQPFWQLAQVPVAKGVSLGALGSGQALVRGGKRSPGAHFSFGRAPFSFNPQSFEWEKLRAPLLAESFAQLEARLASLPPASLRPRRAGEDIYVCPVASVEEVRFSQSEQELYAIVRDAEGHTALLKHPYTARGSEGIEVTLQRLSAEPDALRFVAGQMRRGGNGLTIAPLALIFQTGSSRQIMQPWVERIQASSPVMSDNDLRRSDVFMTVDPLQGYPAQLLNALGELLLVGLSRADEHTTRYWNSVQRQGLALGFSRLLDASERVAEELTRKSKTIHWNANVAAVAILEISVYAHLASEEI